MITLKKIFRPGLAGLLSFFLCLEFFVHEACGGTVVEVFQIHYSTAADLENTVRGLLSEEGTVSVSAPTNALVVMDRPEMVERVRDLLARLDRRPKNIRVEVEFIEEKKLKESGMDVRWRAGGGGWSVGTLPQAPRHGLESNFSAGTSRFNGKKKQFLRLMENRPGRIFVGEAVPFTEYYIGYGRRFGYISRNVTFKDVGTSFSVTARTAEKGKIEVTLDPEVSYYDGEKKNFDVKRASTSIVMDDPGTVALGGLDGQGDSFATNFLSGLEGSDSQSSFVMILTVRSED